MAAPEGKQGFVVDVDTGILRRDRVLVQHAPAAVVVMGFGPRAEELRRFACAEAADDDDPFLDRCRGVVRAIESGRLAKTGRAGLPRSVLKIKDRTLRRLAIAEALAKAGFDPDEPRDERGRWTSEGGGEGGPAEDEADRAPTAGRSSGTGGASAAAAATLAPSAPEWAFSGDVTLQALQGLAQLADRYSSPAGVFLDTYFFGINRTYKTQGVVPDRPDITWEYDADTLALTLSHNGEIIYAGQNQYGLIRDRQGRVVGRFVGGNIAFDRGAVSAAVSAADSGADSRAGAQPLTETDADRNKPKLCADPEFERSSKGWSNEAGGYQMQISGLPWGLGVELNGVMFDGCEESDGTMLEAKAFYWKFSLWRDPQVWRDKIVPEIMEQAKRQSEAARAAGRRVEWYFAEEATADYFRQRFESAGFDNITVFYRPYIPGRYKPEKPL